MMRYPFEDRLERREMVAGCLYFPFHFLIFPLLSGYLAELGVGVVNLIFYGLGLLFLLLFMLPWLYRQYNVLCDRPVWCLSSMAWGYLVNYALSGLVVLLLMSMETEAEGNPNNSFVLGLQGFDGRVLKALAIFMAPLLEETLLRGVIFGSLHRRSRAAAYGVSILLFSICHVWQFVLSSGDSGLWLYVLQYIPASLGLCYAYERSGSIWTPIFLHTFINAMAFSISAA